MKVPQSKIAFDHEGIGTILQRYRLKVPVNQREYSWKKEHVQDLLQDFSSAIANNQLTYFLGTVVLTLGETSDTIEVTDGQQRLATTTILLAAIRDYLHGRAGTDYIIKSLDQFLFMVDRSQNDLVPRLTLNVDDAEFFRRRILPPTGRTFTAPGCPSTSTPTVTSRHPGNGSPLTSGVRSAGGWARARTG